MKRSGAIGNKVAVTRRHIGEYDANRRLDIRDIRKITKDLILVNNEVSTKIWGCSSAGRAPALQAGGQEFDSPHLHQHLRSKCEMCYEVSEQKQLEKLRGASGCRRQYAVTH